MRPPTATADGGTACGAQDLVVDAFGVGDEAAHDVDPTALVELHPLDRCAGVDPAVRSGARRVGVLVRGRRPVRGRVRAHGRGTLRGAGRIGGERARQDHAGTVRSGCDAVGRRNRPHGRRRANTLASMRLTPTDRDRLLIFTAAELARARRARGLRLNVPEATALIADTVCEAARDGRRVVEAAAAAASVLGPDDVLPGVVDIVSEVKVEAVFDDGTRMVVVRNPFGATATSLGDDAPGAILVAPRSPEGSPDASGDPPPDVVTLTVVNTGDVPVSITSHFHFFEVNPRLRFDRAAAYGRRLAIAAGASLRFDPGAEVTAPLVPIGGARVAIGFAGLVDGPLDAPGAKQAALARAAAHGYLGADTPEDGSGSQEASS